MIYLIVSTVLLVLGICLASIQVMEEWPTICGIILIFFGGLFLLMIFITIPVQRMDVREGIQRYNALKETIIACRAQDIGIEKAGLVIKIAEMNKDIASVKYYNQIFDWWIPDEVMNLEPLQ